MPLPVWLRMCLHILLAIANVSSYWLVTSLCLMDGWKAMRACVPLTVIGYHIMSIHDVHVK
jgi:hypothetical protein